MRQRISASPSVPLNAVPATHCYLNKDLQALFLLLRRNSSRAYVPSVPAIKAADLATCLHLHLLVWCS